MHAGRPGGQQPGPSWRVSRQIEEPSSSLERRKEIFHYLNRPRPSNAAQGSQMFPSASRQPQSAPSNLVSQIRSAQRLLLRQRNAKDLSEEDKILKNGQLFNAVRTNENCEEKLKNIKKHLDEGAYVSAGDANQKNNTPLHVAVLKDEPTIVELLLGRGASVSCTNSDDNTPLNIAERLGKKDIVELLKRHERHLKKRNRIDFKEHKPEGRDSKKMRISRTEHRPMEVDQDTGRPRPSVSGLFKPSVPASSGLKDTFHGVIYQVKLLMLFLMQGLDKKYSFRFDTEMKADEKYYKFIFQYKNKDVKVYRFLQAKHKQDENTKITANDLLKETDKKLSLQEFFISYRKIKKDQPFNGHKDKIKDFIICTNIDLGDDLQHNFELVGGEDDILDLEVQNLSKEPKRLKFKKFCSLRGEMLTRFQEASDLHRLAETLAEHIFNDKTIKLKNPLFDKYHGALADEVIDIKTKKIKMDFIIGSSYLSEEGKKFRKVLLDKSELTEDAFMSRLEAKNLKISGAFGNVLKLEEIPQIAGKSPHSIQELAKKIVDKISEKKTSDTVRITLGAVIKEIFAKLAGHIFIKAEYDTIKFRQGFLDGDTLPGNLNDFREAIKAELSATDKEIPLGQCRFEMNIHTCTEEGYKEYQKDKLYFEHRLPNDEVTIEEIDDFLGLLVFAVNQPNEDELCRIIADKLGKEFNLIDSHYIATTFQADVRNWVKGKEVCFLTSEEGRAFFNDEMQKLSKLVVCGRTAEYCTEINNLGITYSQVPTELRRFLTSNDKQIFNLTSSHQTTLGFIKVYHSFKDMPAYERDDSYILTSLSSLLLAHNSVTEAFNSEITNNLLVIECDVAERSIEELYEELSKTVQSNIHKKVILITKETNALAGKFKENFSINYKYEEKKDENNSFIYLTEKSQKTLLSERQIIFQGKRITLEKLMEIKDVNKLSKEESDHLDKMIDAEALMRLMRKEIEVGIKRPDLSDLESIYYVASVRMEEKQFLSAVRNNPSDLFVIGGTTKDKFSKLIAKLNTKEEVAIRVLGKDVASNGDKFIILTNKGEEKKLEDFKRMCSYYRNIRDTDKGFSAHFIEKKNYELIWKRSYNASFYIPRNFYGVVINNDSLRALIEEEPEGGTEKKDIIAISGIGKSKFENRYKIKISKNENISTEDNSNKKNHIIILEDEKSFEDLNKNAKRLQYYNLHLLQNKSSSLIWRRSKGEINKIHRTQDTENKYPFNKDDLNNITATEKAVVITGDPGMGKSTTLAHLLKTPEELEWIIKLNLINLQQQLKALCGVRDLDGFIEKFFSKIGAGIAGKFAEELLKYRIEQQGHITLLFDGFDEVADENQHAIIKLLSYLISTKAKIQITTSLQAKDKLEDALSVFSYTFQPFTEGNQKELLEKFWEASFKLTVGKDVNNTLGKSVGALFESFYQNIKDNKYTLVSIPLLTRIFAETYQESVEHSYRSGSKVELRLLKEVRGLSMSDLFKKFIEKKYQIYFREIINVEANFVKNNLIKSLNKYHQRLALHKLFPKLEQTKILANEQKLLSQGVEKDLKLVGIIQSPSSEGNPHFVQQTFAEYFAACRLVDMVGRREDNPKYKAAREFLLALIFRDRNEVIREFFDNMVQRKGDDRLRSKWKAIRNCDLLRNNGIEEFVFYNPVEDSNVRTEDRHDAESEKSLIELKQDIEQCMSPRIEYLRKFDIKLIDKLFQKFPKETDIEALQITLQFLIRASGHSYYKLANKVFLKNDNMYYATKHYFTQAKRQNKLDYESARDVLRVIPDFKTFESNLTKFNSSTEEEQKQEYAKRLTHSLTQDEPNSALPFMVIKLFYPAILPYINRNIEKLYDKTDCVFLEGNGARFASNFEILTTKMSEQFCSVIDEPIYPDGIPYSVALFVSGIFEKLIIPFIDMMKEEPLPNVDKLAFLRMLASYTQFSGKVNIEIYIFTTDRLKTTLNLIETMLKHPAHAHEQVQVLSESVDYLYELGISGLKLIDADQKLLVLDPVGEFQYELSTYVKGIVELIKRKHKKPHQPKKEFIVKCREVMESMSMI